MFPLITARDINNVTTDESKLRFQLLSLSPPPSVKSQKDPIIPI